MISNKNKNRTGILSGFLKGRRYLFARQEMYKDNAFILDVGCGEGGLKDLLPKKSSYFGLDVKSNKDKNIYACDITKGLPAKIRKTKFDYVVSLAFVEHIKDVSSFLTACRRVLKVDGKIIITTPHPIGRKIHEIGAFLGLFSKEASEEHEKFLDKKDIERLSSFADLKLIKYKRFLFGFNQLFVLRIV